MTTYVFKPSQKPEDPTCLVDRALVFDISTPIYYDCSATYKSTIEYVVSRFPKSYIDDDEMYEIIFSSNHRSSPLKCRTRIKVPANEELIEELFKQLKNDNTDGDPLRWKLRHDYNLFAKPKPKPKLKPRVAKPDTSMPPPIDPATVPEHLRFMTSSAFKDQAEEFYKRLGYISMNSEPSWIREYFVDRLSTDWPHIARADEAMGGLITQTMTVIAANPRFPKWWRSYAISLLRGNPVSAIDTCKRVISSPDVKNFTNDEAVPHTVSVNSNVRGHYRRLKAEDFKNHDIVVGRPPSVPEDLWDKIPTDLRREALIEMALGLRRGIHPIDTIEEILGISYP